MKLSHKTYIPAALSMLIATTVTANSLPDSFKVAVIKNATGSSEIIKGEFETGLSKIESATESANLFSTSMGKCVALLKSYQLNPAESACSKAIDSIDTNVSRGRQSKKLKALALSNRGIVRYLKNNNFGAMEDFTSAMLLANTKVISDNLAYFKTTVSSDKSIADNNIESIAD